MKKDKKIFAGTSLAALALTGLAGCGGGGDAARPPSPSPSPAPAPQSFAVGGTVAGLTGTGLKLQNNAGDDLAVTANGGFAFVTKLATGATYQVTVKTQPANPDQTCAVAGGSGTVAAANVTSVDVTCTTQAPPATFTIGGTVTGLDGALVLQNNGGDDLAVSASGSFTFAGRLAAGSNYNVGVATQPAGQSCTVSQGIGTVAGANVTDVAVKCTRRLSVTSTTPADKAGDVARDAHIVVEFSAPLDPASVNGTSITLAAPGGGTTLAFTVSGSEVTLTPEGNLLPNAQYTLSIASTVRGAQGEKLDAAVTRTFRTRDGAWGPPKAIQIPGHSGFRAQIAFDAVGDAVAVWEDWDGGLGQGYKPAASRYVAGAGWGAPVVLEPDANNISNPEVAVDPAGNAFAVWEGYDPVISQWTISMSRYSAGIAWDAPLVSGYSMSTNNFPQIATDPNGNAIAVWGEMNAGVYSLWSKQYLAGSGWQADMPLENEDGDAQEQQIAFDKDGNAMAIWEQKTSATYDIWARRYIPGAGWNQPEPLETGDEQAESAHVAWDAAGNAIAVWMQSTPNSGAWSIWSNRFDANTGWDIAGTLVEHIDLAPGGVPQLAVDPAGNAIVVWQQLDLSRSATDIWSNVWTPGTGWGSEAPIETQKKDNANHAHVAVDASGNAIAVWMESDGTRPSIWTNRYTPGAGWGKAQLLEQEDGYAGFPQIAIDAAGNAFAIWQQSTLDGKRADVYVARFE